MPPAEVADQGRQVDRGEPRQRADAQAAGDAGPQAVDGRAGLVELVEGAAGLRQQRPAGLGERDPGGAAVEQRTRVQSHVADMRDRATVRALAADADAVIATASPGDERRRRHRLRRRRPRRPAARRDLPPHRRLPGRVAAARTVAVMPGAPSAPVRDRSTTGSATGKCDVGRLEAGDALRRLPLGRGPGVRARPGATWCGATSPTTGCCGGTRRPARSASSARPPVTPTATRSTREGRLVTCEQGNRRVTRTEHDGSVTVIADRYQGKRLNSPNDAAVRSDGSIWFSDPDFGITSDYEGHRADSEIGACNVYRVDPRDRRGPPGRRRLRRPERARLLPRRAPAVRLRQPRQPHPRLRRPRRRHASTTARSSPSAPTATSTTSASTTAAASGPPRWTTACTATTPTARCSAGSCVPDIVANIRFGGRQAQPAVHRRRHDALLAGDRSDRSAAPSGPPVAAGPRAQAQ